MMLKFFKFLSLLVNDGGNGLVVELGFRCDFHSPSLFLIVVDFPELLWRFIESLFVYLI